MRFSVIYEFDIPMGRSVSGLTPRTRSMRLMEREDGEPSDWCSDLWGGKVKHRKWAGLLNKAQFLRFIDEAGLIAESTETMGSLGAPGCGYGIVPAVSFRGDEEDSIQSAYVTPLLEVEPKAPMTEERSERAWRRVRAAMLRQFGR